MDEAKYFPRKQGFDRLCNILVAYLNAGADRDYVSVGEASKRVNMNPTDLSRNNLFLKSWGFLEEGGEAPGRYRLSPEAAGFASAYRIDPKAEATRQSLKAFLSKHVIVTGLIQRIQRDKPDKASILVDLPRLIGDLKADRVGLNAFLDMLVYAFNLETLLPAPVERPVISAVRVRVKPVKKPMSIKGFEAQVAPFTIMLTVNPETSAEKLKESVKAVLKAYEEYMQERGVE